ncbi:zeta toxin family protein [Candidatus Saccharibacteria bacterium]|nr:zeta toxin family protein [Candidatus Saccharibacteria bacterium]
MISNSGATPSENLSGIFMAGLPGAGKTELSRALVEIANLRPVRIDMDELATFIEGYTPEKADVFRKEATILLAETYSQVLKRKLDFIMDGTFSSKNAKLNIKRALKRSYNIKIVYTCQDPKLAWNFTKAREKVEHRAIKLEGFVKSYYGTIENIKELSEKYKSQITVDVVFKTSTNEIGSWLEGIKPTEIDDMIKVEYNKDNLIKYISG